MIKPAVYAAAIALGTGLLAASYTSRYLNAKRIYAAEITALERDYAQGNAAAQTAYAEALAEAQTEKAKWFDHAQRQGIQLAQTARALDSAREQIKKDINHAIEQDRAADGNTAALSNPANHRTDVLCFGDHGLRLYRRAFGYSETD